MSISLSGQLLSLAAGLLLGVGVGLLYDLLRQLRLLAPRRWMAEGLDLLFWLLACLALFLCGILFGGGQVRLYMVLWLTLGERENAAAFGRPGPGDRENFPGPTGPASLVFRCPPGSVDIFFRRCENFFEKSLFFFSCQ